MSPVKLAVARGLSHLASIVLVGALALGHAGPAFGQSKCWTTVGSTGTVDEADTRIVAFDLSTVTVKPGLNKADLNVRYNIVATDGLFGGDRVGMGLRYTDNGPNAHVVVHLREVNLQTGATANRMSFDSDAFPQAAGAQTQFVNTACSSGSFFDFATNVYYLDVELIKTGAGGTPTLQAVNICQSLC